VKIFGLEAHDEPWEAAEDGSKPSKWILDHKASCREREKLLILKMS
jgi:hypothetical protein